MVNKSLECRMFVGFVFSCWGRKKPDLETEETPLLAFSGKSPSVKPQIRLPAAPSGLPLWQTPPPVSARHLRACAASLDRTGETAPARRTARCADAVARSPW